MAEDADLVRWQRALDTFAAALEARGRGVDVEWAAVEGLPALPEPLRERASLLAQDAARLELALLARRTGLVQRQELVAWGSAVAASARLDAAG